jgi:hypothetical protein
MDEDLKCPFCDSSLSSCDVINELVVLPCTHKVCRLCIDATSEQACPLTTSCRAMPLTIEGESMLQAVVRKRKELDVMELRLGATEMRMSLALDKAKEDHEKKIRKIERDFVESKDSFLMKALGITRLGPEADIPRQTMKDEIKNQRLVGRDLTIGLFGNEYRLVEYFRPYRTRIEQMNISDKNRLMASSTFGKRLIVNMSEPKWQKMIHAPYSIYAMDHAFYVVKPTVVFRCQWDDPKKRIQMQEITDMDHSTVTTRDWDVPQCCRITNEQLNTVAELNDPFCTVDGLEVKVAETRDWHIKGETKAEKVRYERRLVCASLALEKKDKQLRLLAESELTTIYREIKYLETEIDTLNSKVFDGVIPSLANGEMISDHDGEQKDLTMEFGYDKAAVSTFSDIQESVNPSLDKRHWPCASHSRGKTLVVPITHNRALVISEKQSALVVTRGDLLKDEQVKPGRLVFILTDAPLNWAIADKNVLWVKYLKHGKSKLKAFSLGNDVDHTGIGKPLQDPLPIVKLDEVPEKIKADYGIIGYPTIKNCSMLDGYFIADYVMTRTRVWFAKTKRNHIRALGSQVY